MKHLTLLLCTMAAHVLCTAQGEFLQKADSCYNAKNYALAAAYTDKFYEADSTSDGGTFRAAQYNAKAGLKQKAFVYLKRALVLGYAAKYLEQEEDFAGLLHEPQWPAMAKMSSDNYDRYEALDLKRNKALTLACTTWQQNMDDYIKAALADIDTTASDNALYSQLTGFNNYPVITNFNGRLFLHYTLNDSASAPYLVTLPDNYDAFRPCPLLVVLHGAVYTIKQWPRIADTHITGYDQKYFTKYARENNMVIVYPFATAKYNWMYPDDGFAMVPGIIAYLKHFINIDDNRVYITGHSNGATGAFNYLIKQPGLFAAFAGMNTQPRTGTGGTFVENVLNRSFYNIGTDKDYYYPAAANDTLNRLMQQIGADWTLDMHKGYPHWFPEFEAADQPVKKMFGAMLAKQRNPFHANIYWQCDDIKYGRCDWLEITDLDTLKQKAPWQKQHNFDIHPWIYNQNPDSILDITKPAFTYPRKSGAVIAGFSNNVFTIQASCTKAIRLYISPEMVDFAKPVKVIVNGRQVYNGKIGYNRAFMLEDFKTNFDRKAVWVDYIDITL